jgi:twinkle protein
VQVACYRDPATRAVVAQKVRFPNKDFVFLGDPKAAGLYGQHLWKPGGGKMVVVTEGELDAISVSQMQGHKWPVVSIPTGAAGARKAIASASEWLESFEKVVFLFDMDDPGRSAAQECSLVLSPGKAFIGDLPLKDASDMVQAGREDELRSAIWSAKPYRPDGILSGDEITPESLTETCKPGLSTPYPELDVLTRGLRKGELVLLTAGTGVGKSTLARELGYHLAMTHAQRIGNLFLEESVAKTAQGYVAIHNNIPLGRLRSDPKALTPEQLKASLASVISGRMFFYNHFGSLEADTLLAKLKFMASGLGVDWIILDHISIVVSGMTSSSEGERKDIDLLMTRLRSLIEQTGVGVIAIVHLKQPEGKAHEEGAEVSLNQLRGSGTLKQIPDTIIATERDQQGEDPCLAKVRLLKNREWGDTGPAGYVRYDRDTGRLLRTDGPDDAASGFASEPPAQAAGTNKDF